MLNGISKYLTAYCMGGHLHNGRTGVKKLVSDSVFFFPRKDLPLWLFVFAVAEQRCLKACLHTPGDR